MTKKEHEKELRCYPAALTAAEVAEILRVSTKTVYKLIKEKSLPAVKVGRENRIAKSQLIDYLRQREVPSSNPMLVALGRDDLHKSYLGYTYCDDLEALGYIKMQGNGKDKKIFIIKDIDF